jgi:hypothetical protein
MFLMIAAAHVAEIGGVPVRRRFNAIWPSEFDALVLSDGSRLSVRTFLSRGTAHIVRIEKQRA